MDEGLSSASDATLTRSGRSSGEEASSSSNETKSDSSPRPTAAKVDKTTYLHGPRVFACGKCRTHLSSHDDIISKSFHGRHGRAYLFNDAVNVRVGSPEDRLLITGLHSVCDIFCERCDEMLGWTYSRCYEPSQKYKEGKFIFEKKQLHLEESAEFCVPHPPGERCDRWRRRSMSHGTNDDDMIYEYPLET